MEHVTAQNFEEKVANADTPVVLDFYADWCGPCRILGPRFEALAEEISDAQFYKVNVDNASELAARFGVQSIPTILVFKNGELVERGMGAMPKDQLEEMVEKHL